MRSPLFLLLVVVALAACEDKIPDTVGKYQLRFQQLQRTLIMAQLPLPTEKDEIDATRPLDPPVVCTGDGRGNTDILAYEKAVGSYAPPVNLEYPSILLRGFDYYTAFHPFSPEEKRTPGASIVAELESMLARRYVVVYRTIENFAPAPAAGGRADMDAFLIDLKSGALLRHVRILALTPPGAPSQDLYAAAHDSLLDALASSTGGKFEIARKQKAPPPQAADSTLLAGLPANDPNAPKPLVNGGSAEAIVAANIEYARQLTAKHESTANVCRSVLIMSRLNKLPPDLMAEAKSACGGPSR